ncbi:hypothetical protein [Spongiactinospora sp. 9N601]|uniref:hypothetical protein n=1 Tax=Spongiactinospora sp. 9N601 TaxID=3375149 RepID=UPI0037B84F33
MIWAFSLPTRTPTVIQALLDAISAIVADPAIPAEAVGGLIRGERIGWERLRGAPVALARRAGGAGRRVLLGAGAVAHAAIDPHTGHRLRRPPGRLGLLTYRVKVGDAVAWR